MAIDKFYLLLQAYGYPLPEREVIFAKPRRWRADYLWRDHRLIVERDGGLFSDDPDAHAAHASPAHILRDMRKGNAAQLLGYRFLRYTPQELDSGKALADLARVLPRTGRR